jgi:hypothetical protein
MPIYDIRSVSQIGTTEPFELQVARGQIPGHSIRNIFGENPAIGDDAFRTPWENNTQLPFLSAEQNLSVVSTSALDTDVVILINGLDGDYKIITEIVALNGTTPVVTSQKFFRINDLITQEGNAQGDITTSFNGVVYAKILAGRGRNQAAAFTVPAKHAFYLGRIDAFTATANSDTQVMTFRNQITNGEGRIFNVGQTRFLNRIGISRPLPFRVGEKATIEFQFQLSNQTADIGVFADGFLVREEGPL